MTEETQKKKRGFALLTPEQRKEIAARGGRAAQARGTGHRFFVESARIAGQKGGRKVSENREHMRAIGAKGGKKRQKVAANPQPAPGEPTSET